MAVGSSTPSVSKFVALSCNALNPVSDSLIPILRQFFDATAGVFEQRHQRDPKSISDDLTPSFRSLFPLKLMAARQSALPPPNTTPFILALRIA